MHHKCTMKLTEQKQTKTRFRMDDISIVTITRLCEKSPEEIHNQLLLWGLVPNEGDYRCKKCSSLLRLGRHKISVDGLRWVCTGKVSVRKQKRKPCLITLSYRAGTFFGGSQLSLLQVLGFVNLWVADIPLTVISQQLAIEYKSTVDWASFCREVVLDAMFSNSDKLGGPGVTVEIDESELGRRKYRRGHWVEGQCIFGGYERGTGRVFIAAVEKRSADTLLPILRNWVLPGTTVISRCWGVYHCLGLEEYTQLKVNHSLTFKDLETGAHSNGNESPWRAAKAVAGGVRGKRDLARDMFYRRCHQLNLNRTTEFYRLAGKLYNPVENVERHVTDEEMEKENNHGE